MTIEEAINSTELFLTAEEVASLLHTKPQRLREKARHDPDGLHLRHSWLNDSTVIFPRIPFLEFFGITEKPATNGELQTTNNRE